MDDGKGGSVNDLRPHSSRNMNKPSGNNMFGEDYKRNMESDNMDDMDIDQESTDSLVGVFPGNQIDNNTVNVLVNFGYTEEYVRQILTENVSCYCNAAYILYNLDQNY
jgi:hypothetical protein